MITSRQSSNQKADMLKLILHPSLTAKLAGKASQCGISTPDMAEQILAAALEAEEAAAIASHPFVPAA